MSLIRPEKERINWFSSPKFAGLESALNIEYPTTSLNFPVLGTTFLQILQTTGHRPLLVPRHMILRITISTQMDVQYLGEVPVLHRLRRRLPVSRIIQLHGSQELF